MPASILRRSFTVLTLVLIAFSLHAQSTTTTKTKRRPNIPGSIILDFGFNSSQGAPDLWKQRFFGSHTINVYYQYPVRFGRSPLSFNPGIGVSFERFKWKNSIILTNNSTTGEKYEFARIDTQFGTGTNQKLTFGQNYLEVPIEFRYDTKPEDISRSFNFALGARGGWLFDSFQKVKYKEDGQTKKNKDRQDWGLTQLRYGVYTRIGIGGFNLFGFYNLTPLFQKDKGPFNNGTVGTGGAPVGGTSGTTMNTFTVGISLNGF